MVKILPRNVLKFIDLDILYVLYWERKKRGGLYGKNMEKGKLYLINKIFNDKKVRTVWNKESEKYYVSVVDVVGIISDSKNKQAYWRKLKQRLKEEGNETVTNCHTLKLKAQDGKYCMTDVTDIEGMFRIIESIPSKNAEPIKQWLASR